MTEQAFKNGTGAGGRVSYQPPRSGVNFPVQAPGITLPHYPFQPLPAPAGPAPYRFDLSALLSASDIAAIEQAGVMAIHTVGDTGDYRGQQKDFVAQMLVDDANQSPADRKPAVFYHLGDVIYFAGDIDKYGDNFYETYKNYPGFIVSIPGNHDCQPDDPQDGPVDPAKVPLDGWVQNFMSKDPSQLGSLKTGSARTQMDLPNVFWTFTTPFAAFIGLFSNVGETEGEFHQDQIDWFKSELSAADPDLALVVAVHHPPYSGDDEHAGSSVVETTLFDAFAATGVYPHLVLSGHVHNYQRFTKTLTVAGAEIDVPCIVAGAGGYTNLGRLHTVNGAAAQVPLAIGGGLTLEQYDDRNFGFLRLEFSKDSIGGTYHSAPYAAGQSPVAATIDHFRIDRAARKITTG